jgi:hypothetical protein
MVMGFVIALVLMAVSSGPAAQAAEQEAVKPALPKKLV